MTACYLLETYVSLFFFAKNHTPSIIFEGKTSKCEVSKIFGCCESFCLQFGVRHSFICWPVIPELMISSRFSHAKDLRFFLLLQKSPMDLGKGLYTVSSANYLLGFAL